MKILNSTKCLLVNYGYYGIICEGKLVGCCTHIIWAPSRTASAALKSITLLWVDFNPKIFNISMMPFDVVAHETRGKYLVFHDCCVHHYTGNMIIDTDYVSINFVEAKFCSVEKKDAY